jgi:predicted GIY-YIG superfamily endonuclease
MDLKYKRMLAVMEAKEARSKKRIREPWFLYILECCDGSFYTGITKNIEKRFNKHSAGTASRYTRTRLPLKLLYRETCGSRTQALVRECKVKALPRKKKLALIESN